MTANSSPAIRRAIAALAIVVVALSQILSFGSPQSFGQSQAGLDYFGNPLCLVDDAAQSPAGGDHDQDHTKHSDCCLPGCPRVDPSAPATLAADHDLSRSSIPVLVDAPPAQAIGWPHLLQQSPRNPRAPPIRA